MSSSPAIPPKGKAQIQKAAFIFLLQNKCVWTCPLTWLSAEMCVCTLGGGSNCTRCNVPCTGDAESQLLHYTSSMLSLTLHGTVQHSTAALKIWDHSECINVPISTPQEKK